MDDKLFARIQESIRKETKAKAFDSKGHIKSGTIVGMRDGSKYQVQENGEWRRYVDPVTVQQPKIVATGVKRM